jgi:ABC-type uncharacterized transport system permease subunit
MMAFNILGWIFASVALLGAVAFFWRGERLAGFIFTIVFMVVLASTSEKRIVLSSAMLGLTFESDRNHSSSSQ